MLASGVLCPDLLVERSVGLTDGNNALKAMSKPASATVGGITIIDPTITWPFWKIIQPDQQIHLIEYSS